MKIKLEIIDGKAKSNLIIDGEDLFSAKQRVEQFLEFAYKTSDENIKTHSFKPEFLPDWIGEYDINGLSQKNKLFILLERDHKKGWVRSQDKETTKKDGSDRRI
jgi:hypothetical protein